MACGNLRNVYRYCKKCIFKLNSTAQVSEYSAASVQGSFISHFASNPQNPMMGVKLCVRNNSGIMAQTPQAGKSKIPG
jgi:hypothetical protein